MDTSPGTLWTVGHSTRPWPELRAMLDGVGVTCLVDVRRYAGSRRNPQYSPEALRAELGPAYLALPGLGGRRTPVPGTPNGAWRVDAFRGYADHLASPEYVAARDELVTRALAERCVVMCAEAVWWRCHRRLIADDLTLRGWHVVHLMGASTHVPHRLHPDARLVGDVVRYPPPGTCAATTAS